MTFDLHLGDCLEYMRGMEADSVDLIATDPPYYKVKNEWWDRQWDSRAGFLAWLGTVLDEFYRILKPNGSLYVFASPAMAWHVEGEIRQRFNVLNSIRWTKEGENIDRRHVAQIVDKNAARAFLSTWETIIFAEHHGADGVAKGEAGWDRKCDELKGFVFEPLRAYLDGERKRAGATRDKIRDWFADQGLPKYVVVKHAFDRSQWELPTEANYYALRRCLADLNHGGEYLRRDYEDLRRDYEDLRRDYEDLRRDYEDLRRPFNATSDDHYTDTWTFRTAPAYAGKHPTEKPLELMDQIVRLSSRPGDLVFDPFMGSGTTGAAAVANGRRFLGVDATPQWYERARERITVAAGDHAFGLPLFEEVS